MPRARLRHAILAIAILGAISAGLGVPETRANEIENLLALCSDPATSAGDALKACRRVAEEGRLDGRRRALVWMNAGIAATALGRHQEAVDAHGAAIIADPRLAAAFVNRARAHEKLGEFAEALADFAAAISLKPKLPDAYLGRGALMMGRGAPERALPDFDLAVELAPDLMSARYNRGLAYLRLREHGLAEADFSAVIGRNPREAGAYLNRGRARAGLGKDSALNDFDRAVALAPEWAVAWFLRGQFHDQEGDREAANADFQRAYELGHSDPWLIERMRQISGG
jgi:tetratricopeptide (TPR) repeat protein